MSQLKKGAILTYLKIVLTNVIGLILTPFIVRKLGDSEYGVYTLIGSFIAYLGLMNLGINNAIIRFIAKYKAEKDKKGEFEFLGTTMWLYIIISFTLVLIGIIIYFNLESIFSKSLTNNELSIAKIMFLIMIFNLAIALPGGSFLAICNGYENFVFTSSLSIFKYILRAITIFSILILGGKAISIVIIDTLLNVLFITITGYYVFKKLKVKISLKIFNKSLVKDIFSYSLWVFLFGIVYKFQWNAGQVILGMTNDNSTIIAVFGIGVLLGGYYGAFAGGINSVLIPRATQMVVNKSHPQELTDTMIKIGRINTFILLLVLSGFILFGKSFILLWVGDTYNKSWLVALLLMIVMTLPLIQAFGNSILEAKKRNRFKSILSIFTVGIAVIIGYFVSKSYGILGVTVPLVIAMAINSLVMNFYYRKVFGFKIIYFFNKTLLFPIITLSILTYIGYIIINQFDISNWISLLTTIFIYSIITLTIIYFTLLNNYEKSIVIGIIKKIKR